MEEECYPAISMNTASGRGAKSPTPENCPASPVALTLISPSLQSVPEDNLNYEDIKGEPLSAPSSPSEQIIPCDVNGRTIAMVQPQCLHFTRNFLARSMSDSEEDDEEYYQVRKINKKFENSEITIIGKMKFFKLHIRFDNSDISPKFVCLSLQNMDFEDLDIKIEEREEREESVHGSRQGLPPTPPSSASSDSEGTVSTSCSPERRDSQSSSGHVQNLRGLLGPRLYVTNGSHTHTTRQPIHTSLISCQPVRITINCYL